MPFRLVIQRKGDSMNAVFTALSVLSSITGFASSQRFDTSKDHLMDCMIEHFGELSPLVNEESIVSTDDVYDLDGSNRYVLLSFFDNKFVIYDKKDECILKTYDTNPYEGYSDSFKLLGNIEEEYIYAYFNEEVNDFTFIDNTHLSKDDIHIYFTNQGYSYGNYYKEPEIPANAHVIDNAFYFERLNNYHAPSTDGTCAVISTEILLGYYDTFVNDTIVDEQYDCPTKEKDMVNPTVRDFAQSPGVDYFSSISGQSVSRFHDYLSDIACKEIGDDPKNNGMSVSNQKKLIKKYLDEKGIPYLVNSSDGNFSEVVANKAKTIIKNAINQNRPVIACGEGHCSVAYAYTDTLVWVHTGWGYTAATPWRTFESGLFYNYSAGAIDVMGIYNGHHVCSDNYYASDINMFYCPKCGPSYRENNIAPSEFGISTEYQPSGKVKSTTVDDVIVRTTYIRTAMLADGSYLVMSPRKQGEGSALLEFWFTKPIKHFSFDACLYSYNEGVDYSNSNIIVYVNRPASKQGSYTGTAIDYLFNHSLSKNRDKPSGFEYDFTGDDKVVGLYIRFTAPATGTTDSGRLCIGNIMFRRSVTAHGYFTK